MKTNDLSKLEKQVRKDRSKTIAKLKLLTQAMENGETVTAAQLEECKAFLNESIKNCQDLERAVLKTMSN